MCSFSERHETLKAAIAAAPSQKEIHKLETLQQTNLRLWGDYLISNAEREGVRAAIASWSDSKVVKS